MSAIGDPGTYRLALGPSSGQRRDAVVVAVDEDAGTVDLSVTTFAADGEEYASGEYLPRQVSEGAQPGQWLPEAPQ